MTDEVTPNPKQQHEFIVSALKILKFEEVGDMGVYRKGEKEKQTVVDLTAGESVYFNVNGNKVDEDDDEKTLEHLKQIITDAKTGILPTQKGADIVVCGTQSNSINEPPTAQHIDEVPILTEPDVSNIPFVSDHVRTSTSREMPELSIDIIKKYINNKVTDEEAYVFLQLCQARGLNPFLKEAYLIKYGHNAPATMVVGKDAFLKRAEAHKEYNGFEAGIIIEIGDEYRIVDEREGTFYADYEKDHIIGGWAKIYRKDQEHPTVAKVACSEYVGLDKNTGKPNRTWGSKPATMIRKVALVQALREAFPSELSGMYDQSEMGVDT